MSSNLFGQFKIYPRGFLGAKLEPVLINNGSATNRGRLQYDVSVFDANEPELITANMAIEEAYIALVRNDIKSGDFQFREDTLRAIFKAFGTQDFEGWYMAQYQSPSFGEMQRDFIEDCLRFLLVGKRQMALNNWDDLLKASDKKVTDIELPEMAKRVFNKKFVRELTPLGRTKLPGIVQDWVSKPNGFVDLVTSCHILFGIKR
jgi:hypothetical protein